LNYALHYKRLIAKARGRTQTPLCAERHHVVPRCIGGANDTSNLVDLTPEEHYVAHQLLTKIYPHVHGLAYAVVKMAKQCTGNKAYGWLRRNLLGRPKSEESRRRMAASGRVKVFSDSHRANLSKSLVGNKHLLGKKLPPLSEAHKKIIGARYRGKTLSVDARRKMSEARRGKVFTAETREKIGAASRAWHARRRAEVA
jgi:hypothetical protein